MKNKHRLLYCLFILMIFSLINNYSAGYILNVYNHHLTKQLLWFGLGFLIIFIMSKINLNFIIKNSFYLYVFVNVLLLINLIFGVTINGSTSWLRFGFISIQPSEFVKVALILYLYHFSITHKKMSNLKYIMITFLIVLIPSILTFLEPDTGAVLFYLIIYLVFLITKKIKKGWFLGFGICLFLLLGGFFLLYFNYESIFIKIFGTSFFYRMDRVTMFIQGEGYQINKALISIGSSSLFGRGLRNLPEYFPEAPTDFAFALLINNLGLIGSIIFLMVYSYFIYLMINKIKHNKKLVSPIVVLILFQVAINLLMNIGLFPVIGITLPFISYGGSNLISYFILIGILINQKKVSKDT